jgi:hypothetical protein
MQGVLRRGRGWPMWDAVVMWGETYSLEADRRWWLVRIRWRMLRRLRRQVGEAAPMITKVRMGAETRHGS